MGVLGPALRALGPCGGSNRTNGIAPSPRLAGSDRGRVPNHSVAAAIEQVPQRASTAPPLRHPCSCRARAPCRVAKLRRRGFVRPAATVGCVGGAAGSESENGMGGQKLESVTFAMMRHAMDWRNDRLPCQPCMENNDKRISGPCESRTVYEFFHAFSRSLAGIVLLVPVRELATAKLTRQSVRVARASGTFQAKGHKNASLVLDVHSSDRTRRL